MPNHLQRSLQECLPKMKKPIPEMQLPPPRTLSSSTSWILRGCKHPKTPSFAFDQKENEKQEGDDDDAATLSDIDRFLLENFKSLYKKEDDIGSPKRSVDDDDHQVNKEEKPAGILIESPRFMDPPENLRGSHRFFVPPGSSSSLMEEARTSLTIPNPCATTTTTEDMGSASSSCTITGSTCNYSARTSDSAKEVLGADHFITVLTYSPNPYEDFKKSMEEMVEARLNHNGKIDWGFMEELLFSYLNLNDKKSYRFILRAFVDVIVFLRENPGRVIPAKPRNARSNSGGSTSKR